MSIDIEAIRRLIEPGKEFTTWPAFVYLSNPENYPGEAVALAEGLEQAATLLAEVDRLTEALQSIAYEGGDCLAVEVRIDDERCGVCAVCLAREALGDGAP